MPTFECTVTWDETVAGHVNHHSCQLPADHIHDVQELRREASGLLPYPAPHRCHCNAWKPVTDVAPQAVEL